MVFESNKVVLFENGMYERKEYVSNRLFRLNVMAITPKNNKAISFAYFLNFSSLWHGKIRTCYL